MKKICNIRYSHTFFNPQAIWLVLNSRTVEDELRSVGTAIDTRGRILRAVVAEAKENINALLQSISDAQLGSCSVELPDQVVYGILRSVDAFFFEALSLYELLKRFYVSILRRARIETGRQQPHASFAKLVANTEQELNFNWQHYLEANRDLFIHETAPYLAVEFEEEHLSQRELVVESEPDVHLRLEDFDNVLKGLTRLAKLCEQDLINKIGTKGN